MNTLSSKLDRTPRCDQFRRRRLYRLSIILPALALLTACSHFDHRKHDDGFLLSIDQGGIVKGGLHNNCAVDSPRTEQLRPSLTRIKNLYADAEHPEKVKRVIIIWEGSPTGVDDCETATGEALWECRRRTYP